VRRREGGRKGGREGGDLRFGLLEVFAAVALPAVKNAEGVLGLCMYVCSINKVCGAMVHRTTYASLPFPPPSLPLGLSSYLEQHGRWVHLRRRW